MGIDWWDESLFEQNMAMRCEIKASNNAAITEEQASTISEVLGLSNTIVTESGKLRTETENITNISENLNRYSDEINSDLSQYTV